MEADRLSLSVCWTQQLLTEMLVFSNFADVNLVNDKLLMSLSISLIHTCFVHLISWRSPPGNMHASVNAISSIQTHWVNTSHALVYGVHLQ